MNISGDRVKLRDVKPCDAAIIAKWKNNRFIRRMALDPQCKTTIRDEEKDIRNTRRSKAPLYLIIALRENDKSIGYIRVNWMDKDKTNAWLRFALGRSRKKGYAADAIRTILRYLFSEKLHRVDAEAYVFNARSIRLLRRLGFRKEGVRRSAHFDGRKYHDVVVLGLLKKDSYTVQRNKGQEVNL
jgi:ribosomal-protein-alanine N-acetyltransferase